MKRTPLPAHDFPDEPNKDGDRPCQTEGCTTVWKAAYDDPPPWGCVRGSRLDRGSGPPPVAEGGRKGRTDPETGVKHTYGPVWEWISKNLPCCVCGRVDGAPADHWKTVKTGGKDPGNCLSLCRSHQGRHDMGHKTWATVHRIDPTEVAMEAWRAFRRAEPELAEKLEDHLPENARDRAQIREGEDG